MAKMNCSEFKNCYANYKLIEFDFSQTVTDRTNREARINCDRLIYYRDEIKQAVLLFSA